MKKENIIFAGECIVIAALLLLIGSLVQTERNYVLGKEAQRMTLEEGSQEQENEGQVEYAKDLLKQQEAEDLLDESGMDEGIQEEKAAIADWEKENLVNAQSMSTLSGNDRNQILQEEAEEGVYQIAVFGDSIWDDKRGEDGISERLEELLEVEVYNCAIGGTSASVISDPTDIRTGWRSTSLNGLMYIARGEENSGIIEGKPAKNVIDTVNFSGVDCLIISYGLNDFFSQVNIYPDDFYDMTSYVGALRHAVAKMTESFTDLEVLLIGPTYTEFFADPNKVPLSEYAEAARQVAEEYNIHFLDMYHELGINGENHQQYLYDEVHLSQEGRALYAEAVAHKIAEIRSE